MASSRDATSEEHGSNEDVFATQTPVTTAKLIADHLWWRDYERKDNLVSWSSSMLFLIRYIFYGHHRARDGASLHAIRLLILDSDKFPCRTFIQDCDLISAFRGFDARERDGLKNLAYPRADTIHYFGACLSQGSLCIRGKCSTVSAQDMIDKGLLKLHPVFRQAWTKHLRLLCNLERTGGFPLLFTFLLYYHSAWTRAQSLKDCGPT